MYSYEISDIMQRHNNNINANTYINIIQTSPQINHVIYQPFGNYYEIWDKDGCYWKFTVFKVNSSEIPLALTDGMNDGE